MTNRQHADNSNWARWGDADEIGALNLITDEKRLADIKGLKSGKIYSLGLPAQRDHLPYIPYRGPAQRLTIAGHQEPELWEGFGSRMGTAIPGVGANEDLFISATHTGTHIDALSHVFADQSLYNGFPIETVNTMNGATRAGIDKIGGGGIAGRAVLLDVAGHLGVDHLEPRFAIGDNLLEEVREAQGTIIHEGDVLLVHTGWTNFFLATEATGDAMRNGQAGIDLSAVEFVDRHQISAVGADNSSVEVMPFDETYLSVHVELLHRRGIHLLEHLDLREMAADRVHECFLVAAPIKIVGGFGSPINPIAIA